MLPDPTLDIVQAFPSEFRQTSGTQQNVYKQNLKHGYGVIINICVNIWGMNYPNTSYSRSIFLFYYLYIYSRCYQISLLKFFFWIVSETECQKYFPLFTLWVIPQAFSLLFHVFFVMYILSINCLQWLHTLSVYICEW